MTPIVDTHCHLVYRDALRYAWLDSTPALNQDFPLERYRAEATAAGIADILHMEVDVVESDMSAETKFIGSLGLAGLVAPCRPELPGFEAYLDWCAAQPGVRGFRRILHTVPDELGQSRLFAENLRRIGERGLTFDLCLLARQLPIGIALARACPNLQFVLDHCGNPDIEGGRLDSWRADMNALAAQPNVACKVSGIVTNAPAGWTVDSLRPVFEQVTETFGWNRVVWGSDWPVCTLNGDLTRWVAATRELLASASEDERQRLLNGNAKRIYGLS